MSTTSLSVEAQLRYLLQWFEEWSELQRTDFLPILAEKVAKGSYVNGVINSVGGMNCEDKPLNLFQCRIKLFNEWFPNWSQEDKNRFVKGVKDIDEQFGSNLESELEGTRVVETNLPDYIQEFTDQQNAENEAKEEDCAIRTTIDTSAEDSEEVQNIQNETTVEATGTMEPQSNGPIEIAATS